jgi:acyl dehydratase
MMGFRGTILHGFATMARAIEGLVRARFAGDPARLRTFDGRFTKPLLLPARVGLYARGADVWVADAPGGPAYLAATPTQGVS